MTVKTCRSVMMRQDKLWTVTLELDLDLVLPEAGSGRITKGSPLSE